MTVDELKKIHEELINLVQEQINFTINLPTEYALTDTAIGIIEGGRACKSVINMYFWKKIEEKQHEGGGGS